MAGGEKTQLISVSPEELTFEFELEKPCVCNLKLVNNTEHHVAFKVKTTSPKKYFVRPNSNVVQPWDSCTIIVTLQAQREAPPDMQCKDKFLIQSTKVAPSTDIDEIPADSFNKDGEKVIEELKLRVVYATPNGKSDESVLTSPATKSLKQTSDDYMMLKNSTAEEIQMVQRLKEERDAMLLQNHKLQSELDLLMRRKNHRKSVGFSFRFSLFVGLLGLIVGFILNLTITSPTPTA